VELQFGFGKDSGLAAQRPLDDRSEHAGVTFGAGHEGDPHCGERAPLGSSALAPGEDLEVVVAQEQAHGFGPSIAGNSFASAACSRTVRPDGSMICPRNAPSKVRMPVSIAVTCPLIQSRRIE
jgi:hypothetical protein